MHEHPDTWQVTRRSGTNKQSIIERDVGAHTTIERRSGHFAGAAAQPRCDADVSFAPPSLSPLHSHAISQAVA